MRHVSLLIKPASSACDLHCAYCFYRDVAGRRAGGTGAVMDAGTARAVVDRALAVSDDADVALAFQGGEPTLAGLGFYQDLVAYVNARRTRQRVSYALQTNGQSLDVRWASFLREHGFLVGISVDGPAFLHDGLRTDLAGHSTHARAMESVRLLRDEGVGVNVLTVLSTEVARHPRELFDFYVGEGIDYVQLIPCLAGFGGEGAKYALTPRGFFSFYCAFFDLWLSEFERGHFISVALFDTVMQLLVGQMPQACGALGFCAPQYVVESTGDVYPCDFYALDEWRLGNVRERSLDDLATCATMRAFLSELRRPCAACAHCPFEGVCHRGCKRMGVSYYDESYCGYRAFLEHAARPLARVARLLAL